MSLPSSVKHPIARPHAVSSVSPTVIPTAQEQIHAAQVRLRVAQGGHPTAHEGVIAPATEKPQSPVEKILANQLEILQRLSVIESQQTKLSGRLDALGVEADAAEPEAEVIDAPSDTVVDGSVEGVQADAPDSEEPAASEADPASPADSPAEAG